MGFGDDFAYYNYISDNGETYIVKLSSITGGQGGFIQTAGSPLDGVGYPFGPRNMRHVWGVSLTGKRARLPIADASNTKFVDGGTFTLHGESYTIQGAIGEKRKLSFLGG